jgi:prepilin-type processing-associated H-X9-DG protein
MEPGCEIIPARENCVRCVRFTHASQFNRRTCARIGRGTGNAQSCLCAHENAFTKWDLLICIATVGMLGLSLFVFLPATGTKCRASRINCVSNLKQVGLGFRMWSNDRGERFPWQVPASEGGTKEFAPLPYAAVHFVLVSNEFNSPKILTCPDDANRSRTADWQAPLHGSLTYFAGISAHETIPSATLSGDRNLSTSSTMTAGLLTINKPKSVRWTGDIHKHAGNIGFADGSVSQTTSEMLRRAIEANIAALTNQPVMLSIP